MNAQSICIDNPSCKSGPGCRVTFLHGSFYLALDRIRSAPPFRSLFLLPPSLPRSPRSFVIHGRAASLGGRGRGVDQLPFLHTTRRGAAEFDEVIKRVLFADCDSGVSLQAIESTLVRPNARSQTRLHSNPTVGAECNRAQQPTHAALFVLTLERCEGRGRAIECVTPVVNVVFVR